MILRIDTALCRVDTCTTCTAGAIKTKCGAAASGAIIAVKPLLKHLASRPRLPRPLLHALKAGLHTEHRDPHHPRILPTPLCRCITTSFAGAIDRPHRKLGVQCAPVSRQVCLAGGAADVRPQHRLPAPLPGAARKLETCSHLGVLGLGLLRLPGGGLLRATLRG